jgi:hypothetical protein
MKVWGVCSRQAVNDSNRRSLCAQHCLEDIALMLWHSWVGRCGICDTLSKRLGSRYRVCTKDWQSSSCQYAGRPLRQQHTCNERGDTVPLVIPMGA